MVPSEQHTEDEQAENKANSHSESQDDANATTETRQRAERLRIRPGFLSRAFVRRPKVTCAVVLLIPAVAIAAIVGSRVFQLDPPTGRDYFIRNDLRTRQSDARQAAREEFSSASAGVFSEARFRAAVSRKEAADQALDLARESGTEQDIATVTDQVEQADAALEAAERAKGASSAILDDPRSVRDDTWTLSLIIRNRDPDGKLVNYADDYEQGENVLTPEAVAELKRLEDIVLSDTDYERFCLHDDDQLDCSGAVPTCGLLESITNHPSLYGIESTETGKLCGRREGHAKPSEEAFAEFLDQLVTDGPGNRRRTNPDFSLLVSSEVVNGSTPKAFAARSVFRFGRPISGYNDSAKDVDKQTDEYLEWITGLLELIDSTETSYQDADVLAFSLDYANDSVSSQALKDMAFAGASIALVFLFVWFHTQSVFLAAATMLQVLLAFPVAYFVYRLVAQVRYFASLQIMTIFLILGIAADDVFVFTDAWKQAAVVLGPKVDLERRMAWTYRRAVKAMTVTSFTTAMAFFVTATSPVMPIATLGVWAGLLVLAQFGFVITLYPCATVMWHRSLRPRQLSNRFRKGEETTYITTEDDLAFERASNPEEPEASESTAGSSSNKPSTADNSTAQPAPGASFWAACLGSTKTEHEYRPIERFFRDVWVVWIKRARFVIIAVAVAVFGASVYLATTLEAPVDTEQFLPDNHRLSIARRLLSSAFPSSDAAMLVIARVVWGIAGIDNSGISAYDTEELGDPVVDDSFSLRRADSQQALADTCDAFSGDSELVSEDVTDPVQCWIRDFRLWREVANDSTVFATYPSERDLVADLTAFLAYFNETSSTTPFLHHGRDKNIVFSADGDKVLFTELSFVTPVSRSEPARVMFPFYEKWVDRLDEQNKLVPETVSKSFVVGGVPWIWQITQRSLVRNAFVGLGIMLSVALAALAVSTLNVIVAFVATLSIAGVVLNLLGIIKVLGWSIGVTESVGIIIATGVSFDFAAHYANAYVESRSGSRYGRTRDALADLGVSVLAGALSTILAGSMLFFTVITFFRKFALFIVLTMFLSLVWSNTVLIAMLLVVGPEGTFGSLEPFLKAASERLHRVPGIGKRKGQTEQAANV